MRFLSALAFTALLATGCSKKQDVMKEVESHADKVCATTDYKSGRKAWTDFLGFLDAHKDAKELDQIRAEVGPAIIDHSSAKTTGTLKRIMECAEKTGAF